MTLLPNLAFLRLKSLAMRKKKDEQGESRVETLLKPIERLDGDDDCDSDVSEISDVFEEFHKNSFLRSQSPPQPRRYFTKHEADVRTMQEFTEDFKETMGRVRNDLGIGAKLLLETPDDIRKIFESPRDLDIFPKISPREPFDDCTSSLPRPEELRQKSRTLSGSSTGSIWHMLATNSDRKKFEISPPGFDTFKQKQPHWLQRASVSWTDIDRATLKCENWLDRHCKRRQL